MTDTVEVYFVRWDSVHNVGRVEPRIRTVTATTLEEKLATALELLLAKPTRDERSLGYATEIPKGTRLLGSNVKNNIAYVDLSSDVAEGGGSVSMLGRVSQIVYTATQFPGIERALIMIQGLPRYYMGGEGVIIGEPLSRHEVPAEL